MPLFRFGSFLSPYFAVDSGDGDGLAILQRKLALGVLVREALCLPGDLADEQVPHRLRETVVRLRDSFERALPVLDLHRNINVNRQGLKLIQSLEHCCDDVVLGTVFRNVIRGPVQVNVVREVSISAEREGLAALEFSNYFERQLNHDDFPSYRNGFCFPEKPGASPKSPLSAGTARESG